MSKEVKLYRTPKYEKFSYQVKNTIVLNPFFWFSAIWLIVLLLYLMNFCEIYPTIDLGLLFFFLVIIICSFIFCYIYQKKFLKPNFCFTLKNTKPNYLLGTICLLTFLVEVAYSKKIPLLDTLAGDGGSYYEFGLPSLTFVFVSLRIALVVLSSAKLIYFKENRLQNFILLIIPCIIFLLTYTRGILFFSLMIVVLIWFSKYKLSFKTLVILFLLVLMGCFVFNILGNIRQSSPWYDSSYLINISGFRFGDTVLSHFSWIIVYLVSPLGNLNFNVLNSAQNLNFFGLISQLIPDFLSKRIFPEFTSEISLVQPGLNVSSTFAGVFKYGGILGMYIGFIELVIFIFLIAKITLKNNTIFIASTASLSAVCIITFFTNPISYSGYSLFILILLLELLLLKKDSKRFYLRQISARKCIN